MKLIRRTLLSRASIAAAGVIASPVILHWPANAAEFAYKYGTALPDGHPMVIRSKEAAAKIKEESGGKLDITLYPNSVLGQDTAMMSQAIAGALEIYGLSIDILAQKNPPAAIFGVGFAFPDYDTAWKAMDGDLGNYLPRARRKGRPLLHGQGVRSRLPRDHDEVEADQRPGRPQGRQDPPAGGALFISLFQHLGASPTPINFGEVYSALQTGLVDGQENPLILIDTAKLYEVQKYCSMTNHIWVGLHISFNTAAWKRLPPDLQDAVAQAFQRRGDGRARRLAGHGQDRDREDDQGRADLQHARHQALPGGAAQIRVLPRRQEEDGRRGLGAA